MRITIRKPGLLTTIQDLGRINYLSLAVPVSGAMDRLSAQIANKALGNDDNCAVIEFTQSGAVFFTDSDVLLALSGAGAHLSSGDRRLPSDCPIFIPARVTVNVENSKTGSRSYLAVAGGWDIPKVLGSSSTYLAAKIGGVVGRCLEESDQLKNANKLTPVTETILSTLTGQIIKYPGWSIAQNLFLPAGRNVIRIMPGPEFNWFDAPSKAAFLSQNYAVGPNSNRMGYNLRGVLINRAIEGELLSTAVVPGTIQVAGSGSLILLMADCQTTGGYPRIAQVAAVDMPLCAQLKPGDLINFKEITWQEAEMLYVQRERDLQELSATIRQKYS